jgi:peptidoglycan-N-acetylglucosamine deacetylase
VSPTPSQQVPITPCPSPVTPTAIPTVTALPSPTATVAPSAAPPPTATPTPVRTAPPGTRAPLYAHGSRSLHEIALTIDDCGSTAAVQAILAILERDRVPATWFPIGRDAAASPALWRDIAAAGFPIGDHTWSHPDLTHLSYSSIVSQIQQADQVLSAIIGQPLLPVLRPPGGAWDTTVLVAAAAAGQQAVVLWDTTFGDTGRGTVAQLITNAERGTNGSIVLMHANAGQTQLALPAVIDFYRTRGYTFVTLGQLLGIPGSIPYAPTPTLK